MILLDPDSFLTEKGKSKKTMISINKKIIKVYKSTVIKYNLKPGNYLIGIEDDGTMKMKYTDGEGFKLIQTGDRFEIYRSDLCKYLFDKFGWTGSTKSCLVTGVDEDGFLTIITR